VCVDGHGDLGDSTDGELSTGGAQRLAECVGCALPAFERFEAGGRRTDVLRAAWPRLR
jgi:hypothetical protein